MRKEIKGVGMTAEEITYADTPEEIKEAHRAMVEAWRVAGNSFEIEIAPIEEWACRQLTAFGFKDLAALREKDLPLGDSLGDRALDYAAQVLRYIGIVRNAISDNNAQEAARFGVEIGLLFAKIQDTLEWEKFALRGKKFAGGRKPGSGGPIRKAIARLLKKNHEIKNPQLWAEVKSKPPSGWTACDNRVGKYLEGPHAKDTMTQRRFFNVCGEERKRLQR